MEKDSKDPRQEDDGRWTRLDEAAAPAAAAGIAEELTGYPDED